MSNLGYDLGGGTECAMSAGRVAHFQSSGSCPRLGMQREDATFPLPELTFCTPLRRGRGHARQKAVKELGAGDMSIHAQGTQCTT